MEEAAFILPFSVFVFECVCFRKTGRTSGLNESQISISGYLQREQSKKTAEGRARGIRWSMVTEHLRDKFMDFCRDYAPSLL